MSLELIEILKKYWGYDQFRPKQEEIIESVLAGGDVLALLPTGGGKSVCYQVPALAREGICIVVSPLVALMKDQVESLRKRGVSAEALFSGLSYKEIDRILDNCVFGAVKLLYVAPERIKSDLFLERFKRMNVNLLAVDEAHCISDWGYDFRPSYFHIHQLRELKPEVPCLALTATATPKVQEDIQNKLKLKHARVFRVSFSRSNLTFSCAKTETKERDLVRDIFRVDGQGIVYVRSRKAAKELSAFFQRHRISSVFYHAGMTHLERQNATDQWMKGHAKVMVATNAFGMGIDKSDVRFVFHYDIPESLEAYYQEAGRAGRDGKDSVCVIYCHDGDIRSSKEKLEQAFPSIEYMREIYQHLANYFRLAVGSAEMESFDFDFDDFRTKYRLEAVPAYNALKKLEDEAFIQFNESFHAPSKAYFPLSYEQLYEFQLKHPRMDLYIKALLRLYGGDMFTHFTTISENKLAKYLQVPLQEARKMVELLVKHQVLLYEPANGTPKLTFLTPRYDASTLPLNKKHLEMLKKRRSDKLDEMLGYVQNSTMCRMSFIVEYFGENASQSCGRCDYCRKHKVDEAALEKQLFSSLQDPTFDLPTFISQHPHYPSQTILRVYKRLTDY